LGARIFIIQNYYTLKNQSGKNLHQRLANAEVAPAILVEAIAEPAFACWLLLL
jgi:hypothetical protein